VFTLHWQQALNTFWNFKTEWRQAVGS